MKWVEEGRERKRKRKKEGKTKERGGKEGRKTPFHLFLPTPLASSTISTAAKAY